VNKIIKMAGLAACWIALLVMIGGHWFALQSVAWGRMMIAFSHEGSFGQALVKTFGGHYPCALCLKVRNGWQQDQQRQEKQPWLQTEKMPEPLWEFRCVTAPPPPTVARVEQPFVPVLCCDFIESPPAPPPRASSWVL
jgi:hypothetical protein